MLVKGNNTLTRDIRSVLLIQLGDIGDVVLSFPCIRTLRDSFPEANIVVAVREKARELIEGCTWATGLISVNKEKRSLVQEIAYQKEFFWRLRRCRFDVAIDLRTGTRGALLAFLSGAPQRISPYAFDGKVWRNRLFTHLVTFDEKPGRHMAEHYVSLLRACNLQVDNVVPEYDIPRERQQMAATLLKKENVPPDRPIVALLPFSLWRYKEWGLGNYVPLINWLTSEYDVSVVIAGSLDESRRAEQIVRRCRKNTFNMAGKTSVGMLAGILKVCSLCIGVDTAGIHIAAAVGTPTVSIFGPSSFVDWAPRGEQHCVVAKDYLCVPCQNKGCFGNGVSRCLDELSIEEVKEEVAKKAELLLRC